jgi:hypothetical protein
MYNTQYLPDHKEIIEGRIGTRGCVETDLVPCRSLGDNEDMDVRCQRAGVLA